MRNPIRYAVVGLLAASLTLSGCSRGAVFAGVGLLTVATVGVGGYYYAKGDLESDYDEDHENLHRASVRGLEDAGYKIQDSRINALNATIEATRAGSGEKKETKVIVKIKKLESGQSHLSIRVGVFGDRSLSEEILAALEKRL